MLSIHVVLTKFSIPITRAVALRGEHQEISGVLRQVVVVHSLFSGDIHGSINQFLGEVICVTHQLGRMYFIDALCGEFVISFWV